MKRIVVLLLLTYSVTGVGSIHAQNRREKAQNLIVAGDSLFKMKEFKASKKRYEKARRSDKEALGALRGLSRIALRAGDWGDVKKWNKKILEQSPGDLAAQYNLGIAHRETGKFKALMLRAKDFGKSEKYLDAVLLADSTFQDAVLQRGLLERWRGHWKAAIAFGHKQVKLKPNLPAGHIGLYNFYRGYLENSNETDSGKWLKDESDNWSQYFLGEYFRKYKKYAEAEALFKSMLTDATLISRVPILLSLVKLNAELDKTREASNYYWRAVDTIQSAVDAQFLFEDAKYIFKDSELDEFEGLSVPDKQRFFHTFWLKRELVPASPVSFRVVEHYRRLVIAEKDYWFDGVRSYVNSPDRLNYLRFPRFYALNQEFNDKGLIYIRHGEPDESARTAGQQVPTNESWLYHEREDRPKLIFHFIIARFATGNNWRLAPSIDNRAMLADRLGWDHSITRVYYANSANELNSTLIQMAQESSEIVETAMSSDYHTWSHDIQSVDTPYQVANFRDENDKTRLVVYVGVATDDLQPAEEDSSGPLSIEAGSALLTSSFQEQEKYLAEISLSDSSRIYDDYLINAYSYTVDPAAYHLSFFVREPGQSKLGGENFTTNVIKFDRENFDLSDLVLSYQIEPALTAGPFTQGELRLVPNPARTYKTTEPVFLYYEIYNLRKDEDGNTFYEIENEIVQLKRKKSAVKKILGAFSGGKKKKSVSFKDSRIGSDEMTREHISFDVTNFEAGEYELRVKVTDRVSGSERKKAIKLELVEE